MRAAPHLPVLTAITAIAAIAAAPHLANGQLIQPIAQDRIVSGSAQLVHGGNATLELWLPPLRPRRGIPGLGPATGRCHVP